MNIEIKRDRVKNTQPTAKKYMLTFNNSESMIAGVCRIYHSKRDTVRKSQLYLFNKKYYLLIISSSKMPKTILNLKEYSFDITSCHTHIAAIVEYGRLICPIKAIERIGKAFKNK